MDLSKLDEALDAESKAKEKMAQNVLSQLDTNRDNLKALGKYTDMLVDPTGNKISVDTFKIGLFKTHAFDWKGETNGIVYLDLFEGKIAIDIRDDSHDINDIELGIPKGPAMPLEMTVKHLVACIADDNNYESAMFATNPELLIKYAIANANKEVSSIKSRMDKFN